MKTEPLFHTSQVNGFVVVKTRSRSPDKRYFASSREDLLTQVAELSQVSLSQEEMLGTRKVCEAVATPRAAISFKES
jgi:5-formaminoimidazole-4-carboxamide-1-beta-D-ribofuranosyl 5'-monophosphate synthetase